MFRIIAEEPARPGVLTERDPFGARPSFGFPVIDFAAARRATSARGRARPARSQATASGARTGKTVSLSYAACIQCRECVTACPEQAISVSTRRRGGRLHARAARADARRSTSIRRRAAARSARWRSQPGPSLDESAARAARAHPRPARALAARAPGGRRELQRLRAGDRRDDQSRCTTWSGSASTWSRARGTPTCCSSPGR